MYSRAGFHLLRLLVAFAVAKTHKKLDELLKSLTRLAGCAPTSMVGSIVLVLGGLAPPACTNLPSLELEPNVRKKSYVIQQQSSPGR